MSVVHVQGRSISLCNPDALDWSDAVSIVLSVSLFAGYHVMHHRSTRTDMHSSLSSHVDFSRVSWAKYIFYDYKNKVTTVQNFRSALMILAYFFQVVLTVIAAVLMEAVRGGWLTSWKWTSLRVLLPTMLLVFSFSQLLLTLTAYFYLHFHTQVEDLTEAEQQTFVQIPAAVLVNEGPVGADHPIVNAKLATAALALQCNVHFRLGWRTMVVGLVWMLWSVSPWMMLVGSVGTTMLLYVNDYPFSSDLQMMMHNKEQEVELEVRRAELAQVFETLPN